MCHPPWLRQCGRARARTPVSGARRRWLVVPGAGRGPGGEGGGVPGLTRTKARPRVARGSGRAKAVVPAVGDGAVGLGPVVVQLAGTGARM